MLYRLLCRDGRPPGKPTITTRENAGIHEPISYTIIADTILKGLLNAPDAIGITNFNTINMKPVLRALPVLMLSMLCRTMICYCQDISSPAGSLLKMPDKMINAINHKTAGISDGITRKTDKYLRKMIMQEKRMQKKLTAKDTLAAGKIFGDVEKRYDQLKSNIQNVPGIEQEVRHTYVPHLDSLHTALNFLTNAKGMVNTPGSAGDFVKAIRNVNRLQDKFDQAEHIKDYLKQRRSILEEQLQHYGLAKEVRRLKKQVYYYQAQVEAYKTLIEDPSQAEAKALALLQKSSLFRDFFNKHSQLAGLFALPANTSGNSMINTAGLQTREGVQQLLEQRFGAGTDIRQVMQQQVQGAQSQLSRLKEKVNAVSTLAGGGQEREMPDFKPNHQKTKRFRDRLELGTSLQTIKSNRFFPSTSDIGLSLGYKLNDKSIVGIGSAYKMGWGKDIRHLSITHQGMGIRSFVDYKIKGNFWLSGGAEMNYRSSFRNFEILNDYSSWQKSALLGLSKKYQVNNKLKGNVQVMYDFLWRAQVVRTQAVVFRVGYSLR